MQVVAAGYSSTKSWAELSRGACAFTCKGYREEAMLVGEVEYLRQMVDRSRDRYWKRKWRNRGSCGKMGRNGEGEVRTCDDTRQQLDDQSNDAWLAETWNQEWEASGSTRVHCHVSDPGEGVNGEELSRKHWTTLNRLRTGVGRYKASMKIQDDTRSFI